MFTIYKIRNKINEKCYVGQTKRPVKRRWFAHCGKAARRYPIGAAIYEFGKENFEVKTLETTDCAEKADLLEKKYIRELKSEAPFGYNLTVGGKKGGKYCEEYREKFRQASPKGQDAFWFGKHLSDEMRQKISHTKSGKIIQSLRGIPHSEARRKNISNARCRNSRHVFGWNSSSSQLIWARSIADLVIMTGFDKRHIWGRLNRPKASPTGWLNGIFIHYDINEIEKKIVSSQEIPS